MEDSASRTRPYAIALVIAAIVGTGAAQRQLARERLELGNAPPGIGELAVLHTDGALLGLNKAAAAEPSSRAAPSPAGAPIPAGAPRSAGAPIPAGTVTAPPGAPAQPSRELEDAAMTTFSDAGPGLRSCLRAERAVRGEVSGKLAVSVRVAANGLVENVDLGPSPVRSEAFDECATLTIAQLVFPERASKLDLEVSFDLR